MKTFRLLACSTAALALLAPMALAFPTTFVEPHFKDCSGTPQTIRPHAYGTDVGTQDGDLDDDGRFEGSTFGGFTENTDSDAIFETIQAAIDNTDTGGVVHVMTPGVYRETLTTDDTVTIRGSATGDVILEANCSGSWGVGIDVTGSNKKVRIENLTIQGFGTGIDMDSSDVTLVDVKIRLCATGLSGPSSANALDLIRCEIRDCSGDGVFGSQGNWDIVDSVISNNDVGIHLAGTGGPNSMTITRTSVLRNAGAGIAVSLTGSGSQLTVHDSNVTRNGGRGIWYSGTYTGSVRVTNSLIEGNGSDGIQIENSGGCVSVGTPTLSSIVAGNRIVGNVGDGLEVKGTGTGCTLGVTTQASARVSVFQNTFALNGGYGLNPNTSGTLACTLGQNQISYNVTGAENGGPVCAAAGASSNSVP